MKQKKKRLGSQGEQLAKKYLRSKGLKFLQANYRTKLGEIDLIFLDNDLLVFVEVKTRSRVEQGIPEESVTPKKLAKITRVADYFMSRHKKLPQSARIDVIAIETTSDLPLIRHHKNVTL